MTASALRLMDYHAAREAEELLLEARAGTRLPGEDRDATHFYRQTGAADLGGREPTTWKRWLQQTRQPEWGPDDLADIEAAEAARLRDSHAAAEAARETYEHLTAERGAIMAELVSAGRTYADVAGIVGVTRARAHQLVAAHQRRGTTFGDPTASDPW